MQDEYQPTSQSDSLPGEPPEWAEYRRGFPLLGQKLLDRYEIFQVREGGFGVVFGVTDLKTNREYAAKTYKPEFANKYASVEQFRAEAAFWLNLEPHPNIVRVYFVEEIQGQPYLFMEYVNGGSATSLRDWLRYGRLGESQAIHFAYQLCLGMDFANREGEVAHGDLKPENLLIDRHDVLKITDFGLAHQIEVKDGKYARAAAGTWAYVPPEKFANQPVDGRWDIFAFGMIFYEMLTGKLPYPFELSHDPHVQFKQLSDFHKREGLRELTKALYYDGIPGCDRDLGVLLNSCLQDLERTRDFKEVRQMMEQHLAQYLPVTSNPLSPGFIPDVPVASAAPSLADLRRKAYSLSKIGQHSQALSILNRLLVHYPEDGRLWLEAGINLLAVGNKSSAYQLMQQAIRLNPQLVEEQPWLKPLLKDDAE